MYPMRNILLTIEYCGTNYCGWQNQPNGISVQSVIEKALKKLTNSDIQIAGSGRTDAGVHAYGQTATFKTDCNIPIQNFHLAINSIIPDDIRIIKAEEKKEDFHARYSATAKKYVYKILNKHINSAFQSDRVWHISKKINVEAMKEASKEIIGTHDFSAFMATGSSIKDTTREIYNIDITENCGKILIEVFGNGFLYNMVRIITGTLVEIGQGKDINIKEVLESKDRTNAGITAPPQGLYLKEVIY